MYVSGMAILLIVTALMWKVNVARCIPINRYTLKSTSFSLGNEFEPSSAVFLNVKFLSH